MRKAFSYVRISTDMQRQKDTQKNQRNAIASYLKDKDVNVITYFEDLAISGAEANRKQFNAMLSRINEIDTLIVYDLSRLSRDMDISIDLMRLLMSNKINIIDVYSNKEFDLNNDNDQLQYLLGSWFSSVERKKIKARQKQGIERFKQEHGFWAREKCKIQLDLSKYKQLKAQELNNRQIASKMGMSDATFYRRLRELRKLEMK